MKSKVLITSAAGKTGYEAAKQLLNDGIDVRIFVRKISEKTSLLQRRGAEVVLGDLAKYEDIKKALSGIKRVYYCHPFIPGLLQNTRTFISAAKEADLEVIVNMGQWLAEFNDQKSIHTIETKQAYKLFEDAGLNMIHLIPGFFADNTFFVTQFVIQLGIMPIPFGKGKNPAVSNEDIGLVIAALLKNPDGYIGQKLRPTGPESLSAKEMAAIFAKVTGHKTSYIHIPEWMFLKAAFLFAKDFSLDHFTISQVRHYMKEYQLDRFNIGGPTDVVKKLTGKEPDDFETIVRRYISRSSNRERNFRNWCDAVKKFICIPFHSVPSVKELEIWNRSSKL